MTITESIKNSLEEIKLLFKKETALKFGSMLTSDGGTIGFEGEIISEGMSLTLDGQPIPDGAYTLESGMIVTVEGGVVVSLQEGEPAPVETDMTEQFAAINEKVTSFEAKFAEIETKLANTVSKLESAFEKIISEMGKTVDVVEGFSKQSATPETAPLNKKQIKFQSDNDRMEAIKQSINNLKTK